MYLLDANLFIQSNRSHYGMDFVPAYWDWLERANKLGTLCSIDKIADEITIGKDPLASWIAARRHIFLSPDGSEAPSLGKLARWANDPSSGFTRAAISTFLASGDYQLVAYAHAHQHVVVTYEVAGSGSKKRVKIPDACLAMGVECINPYEMLRREAARFVLDR